MCQSDSCGYNEVCTVKNGVRDCYCKDHYTINQGQCVRGKFPDNGENYLLLQNELTIPSC